jgi:hypothetical protein
MDAEQIQKYKAFVNDAWDKAVNHKEGERIPHKTIQIAKLTNLQKQVAKAAGLDLSGYSHTISTDFIKHVYDNHSDENKEKKRGNTPITAYDISLIMPMVLNEPDYIISGIIYKNERRIIYGKNNNGTSLIFEHPQTRNKALATISFYKTNGVFSAAELIEQLRKDKRFDFSNVRIIDGTGGNPRSNGELNRPAVANSAEPSMPSISPDSAGKSSSASGGG